jgi:hypothetical protein
LNPRALPARERCQCDYAICGARPHWEGCLRLLGTASTACACVESTRRSKSIRARACIALCYSASRRRHAQASLLISSPTRVRTGARQCCVRKDNSVGSANNCNACVQAIVVCLCRGALLLSGTEPPRQHWHWGNVPLVEDFRRRDSRNTMSQFAITEKE